MTRDLGVETLGLMLLDGRGVRRLRGDLGVFSYASSATLLHHPPLHSTFFLAVSAVVFILIPFLTPYYRSLVRFFEFKHDRKLTLHALTVATTKGVHGVFAG